jgi:D-glycero-D-manno-heptose 1,7-bisphosphate phosphatase
MKRAILLDRDGVINDLVDFPPGRAPRSVTELKLRTDALSQIEILASNGYLVLVITNQPDISRGKMTPTQLHEINSKIQEEIPGISEILTCIHDDSDQCACRKPNNGLIEIALRKYSIDIANSWVIGDQWTDIAAGKKSNIRTILLENESSQISSNKRNPPPGLVPDFKVSNLIEALQVILGA